MGSPSLMSTGSQLLDFDRRTSTTLGILAQTPVTLDGKTILVDFMVIEVLESLSNPHTYLVNFCLINHYPKFIDLNWHQHQHQHTHYLLQSGRLTRLPPLIRE